MKSLEPIVNVGMYAIASVNYFILSEMNALIECIE